MQNIRFTIAAGETKRFEAAGRYLEIIDASGPVDIALSDAAGGIADIARGILSGTYMGTPYAGFDITSATAQTVELFISATEGGTKRQPGVVSVVDGERVKVLQGFAFSAVVTVASGGAGVPIAQIWNGGASTRNVFVQAVTIGSSANDTWNLSTITNVLNTAGANPGNSHDASGGTSSAGPRLDNTGQSLLSQRVYRVGYVQASQDRVITLPRPILLRPNTGLIVALGATTSALRASFEFEEWPI
jgi:hypothetical protein